MSKPLNRSIFLFIALVLLLGFASKFILEDQVIALSPPEIIPSSTPVPTPIGDPSPCMLNVKTMHVYAEGSHSGCENLSIALMSSASYNRTDFEIVLHPGQYELNTDLFANTHTPPTAVPISKLQSFKLTGMQDSSGNNTATITVTGSKLLFHVSNGTNFHLANINFEGNANNNILIAKNAGNISIDHASFQNTNSVLNIADSMEVKIITSQFAKNHHTIDVINASQLVMHSSSITDSSRGILFNDTPVSLINNTFSNAGDLNASIYGSNPKTSNIYHNTIVQNNPSAYEYALDFDNIQENNPVSIHSNIITGKYKGLRIKNSNTSVIQLTQNDFYNEAGNYFGIADHTNIMGNISQDPMFGDELCLLPSSPALLDNGMYIGSKGACEYLEPSDTPEELISRIHINPGQLTATIGSERILFSAQAMKVGTGDVENSTYEWGMSSDNSIGTLFSDPSNQKQAWFTPVRAGRGDIWVTVRIGDYHKTASVPVVVNKLCQERNSCTSDACIQIVPPGGWCASEALPGDVDFNNSVNYQDVIKFKAAFDKKFYPADFNFDGKVNIYDFLLLVKHFGLSLNILDVTKEPISESGGTN